MCARSKIPADVFSESSYVCAGGTNHANADCGLRIADFQYLKFTNATHAADDVVRRNACGLVDDQNAVHGLILECTMQNAQCPMIMAKYCESGIVHFALNKMWRQRKAPVDDADRVVKDVERARE